MIKVIQVNFRRMARPSRFNAGQLSLRVGDYCVADRESGVDVGQVVANPIILDKAHVKEPLRRVIRKATPEDLVQYRENDESEKRAFKVCLEEIRAHDLPMKLSQVEFDFKGEKATVYFTADARVDFRSLVKSLASRLRIRIEMNQIGARDESKMMDGCGACGKKLCCSTWLPEFSPISIRMAKTQNLSLNPSRLSGLCGRLKCCLIYEFKEYEGVAKRLPKPGRRVKNCAGCSGCVVKQNLLEESFVIRTDDGRQVNATLDDYEESLARAPH
jgi:cell fate regulator YaaT (PSP1 superfamily)